jgi:hypothetical protein
MKNNSVVKFIALAVFGLIMLIVGLVLAISLPDTQGIMRTLPYILIGVGSGIFGGSSVSAISSHRLQKDPSLAKQKEISIKDERNIAISNKAKAKAYDLMMTVYSALILVFAIIQVDMYVVLTFVAVYLFVILSMVFYFIKYNKEM